MDHTGATRLLVSLPTVDLQALYPQLLHAMKPPLSVLYRQVVDRKDPKPQGTPSRDFLALGVTPEKVVSAVDRHQALIFHDARCELWIRGVLNEQLVLDPDGLVYCYPDDPSFREVLSSADVAEKDVETLLERDYVKHNFHAQCDAVEEEFIAELNLTEVAASRA
jgi:hypothetical protein